jgi:hypothetical protein
MGSSIAKREATHENRELSGKPTRNSTEERDQGVGSVVESIPPHSAELQL